MAKGAKKKARQLNVTGPKTPPKAAANGTSSTAAEVETDAGKSLEPIPQSQDARLAEQSALAASNDETTVESKAEEPDYRATMEAALNEEREKRLALQEHLSQYMERHQSMEQKSREAFETEKASLMSEVQKLQEQLDDATKDRDGAVLAEGKAQEKAQNIKKKLEESVRKSVALQEKCDHLEVVQADLLELQQRHADLCSQMESEQQSAAAKAVHLEELEGSCASLKSMYDRLREESTEWEASLRVELESSQQMLKEQRSEVEELSGLLAEKAEVCRQTQEERANVEAALKSRQEAEASQQAEYDSLKGKLAKAIRKGKRIEEEKANLESDLAQRTEAQSSLQAELDTVKGEVAMWEERHREKERERLELVKALAEEKGMVVRKLEELEKVHFEVQALQVQLEARNGEKMKMQSVISAAVEKEDTLRQKLKSTVKKGMRMEHDKQQLESQMAELSQAVVRVMNKVSEMTSLKQKIQALTADLDRAEEDLQFSLDRSAANRGLIQELQLEKAALEEAQTKAAETQERLQDQLNKTAKDQEMLKAELEAARERVGVLESEATKWRTNAAQLEGVIAGNQAKLVRAREAIETMRRERTGLTERQAALVAEVEGLRSENATLQHQQDAPEAAELERKLQAAEKQRRSAESSLSDVTAELKVKDEETTKLRVQLQLLQDEIQQATAQTVQTADRQTVESVYQTAANMAQQLNLPFMETEVLGGEIGAAQLQAVQVLLEGATVGIKKTQDQLTYLPSVMSELEASQETVRRLEEEALKLKKEATTPVELPSPNSTSYFQTTSVKRREVQDGGETHVVDVTDGTGDDVSESKTGDYTPLISVQAFRSAPPPVLHFLQSVDRQTQGAGRLLGHRPVIRAGLLAYAIALHVLLILIVV